MAMGDHAGHAMPMGTSPPDGMNMKNCSDMCPMMASEKSGMAAHSMDMMKMYFHTGLKETVLFYQWKITNLEGMVMSCIGIFIMAFLYEGLKVLREHLLKKFSVRARFSSYALSNSRSQESTTVMVDSQHDDRYRFCSWPHFLQTFLHVVQVLVSYFLMLIFMTYNVWLCLAVIAGAGAGYLAFGWKKAIIVDINEHCH